MTNKPRVAPMHTDTADIIMSKFKDALYCVTKISPTNPKINKLISEDSSRNLNKKTHSYLYYTVYTS